MRRLKIVDQSTIQYNWQVSCPVNTFDDTLLVNRNNMMKIPKVKDDWKVKVKWRDLEEQLVDKKYVEAVISIYKYENDAIADHAEFIFNLNDEGGFDFSLVGKDDNDKSYDFTGYRLVIYPRLAKAFRNQITDQDRELFLITHPQKEDGSEDSEPTASDVEAPEIGYIIAPDPGEYYGKVKDYMAIRWSPRPWGAFNALDTIHELFAGKDISAWDKRWHPSVTKTIVIPTNGTVNLIGVDVNVISWINHRIGLKAVSPFRRSVTIPAYYWNEKSKFAEHFVNDNNFQCAVWDLQKQNSPNAPGPSHTLCDFNDISDRFFKFTRETQLFVAIGRACIILKGKYDQNDEFEGIDGALYDITDYNMVGARGFPGPGAFINQKTSGKATDLQAGYSGSYYQSEKDHAGEVFFGVFRFKLDADEYDNLVEQCDHDEYEKQFNGD